MRMITRIKRVNRWLVTFTVAIAMSTIVLSGQGTLSNQVLALLARVNTWIATNTFQDLRIPIAAIPSDTAARIYTDISGNLYYNGALLAGAGGVTNPHNVLSSTHPDTLAAAVVRGDVIIGNATPKWARLGLCTSGFFIGSNGLDTVCSSSAAAFTNIPGGQITGTIAAVSGVNLTSLNASNLTSGTVPLAQLAGILNAQIGAGAAIAYSKLSLTGSILNADVSGSAAIAYSKLALTGSVVTGDLAAGTLLFDRWASNSCVATQVPYYNGASWVCRSLITSDVAGAGTATSVALSAPGQFSVTGSPVTTTGTLALAWANQTANLVLASPNAATGAPTFRALVNGDLPLSGVGAGSYAKVTVNTAGVVTAATAQASLTADVSGILPMANGGTGVGVSADDTVLVGSGAAWVARTITDCPSGALAYTQATNLFSCVSSGGPTHNLLSATHPDTLAAAVVRGDLIVGNSSPAWARKAIGTAGQVLQTDGIDASWGNTLARGTIAVTGPWSFTQTWNAGGVTFTGLLENITNTASAAGSLYLDLQLASVSKFSVNKNGSVNLLGNLVLSTTTPTITAGFGTAPAIAGTDQAFRVTQGTPVGATGTVTFGSTFTNAPSCIAVDETTTTGNPVKTTATTTTVAFASGGTFVAADKIAVICHGF